MFFFSQGKQAAFRHDLLEWIKTCGFSSVVVLTSSSSHERIDCQLTGYELNDGQRSNKREHKV